jgi:hypothetical protein
VSSQSGDQIPTLNFGELIRPLSKLTSQPGRLRRAPPLNSQQTRSATRLRIDHALSLLPTISSIRTISAKLSIRIRGMAWSGSRGVNTTAAGYGNQHQKLRAALAKRHQPTDPCVRCGHALGPMGPWLHLDHNDARTGYLGFSHGGRCPVCGARCNLKAAAKKARAIQLYGTRTRRTATDAHRW